jgi:hypothetical protein
VRIRIQAVGVPLTAPLLEHTDRRLRHSLASRRITKVVVSLGETSCSQRGVDKYCRLQVYLERAVPVLIEDSDPDLYAVIDRVAGRAGRMVAMCVGATQERKEGGFDMVRLGGGT